MNANKSHNLAQHRPVSSLRCMLGESHVGELVTSGQDIKAIFFCLQSQVQLVTVCLL